MYVVAINAKDASMLYRLMYFFKASPPFRHSFWQVHCSIDLDFVPLVVEIGILFC